MFKGVRESRENEFKDVDYWLKTLIPETTIQRGGIHVTWVTTVKRGSVCPSTFR